MKKVTVYRRIAILNEIIENCTIETISDMAQKALGERDVQVSIKEVGPDFIVFRSKNGVVLNSTLVTVFTEVLRQCINLDIIELLQDKYSFKYDESYLDEEFVESIISINHDGKLVMVVFDL